jgi:small-conductance mechanosensitive channel
MNSTMNRELASLWRNLMADFREPDIVWQILAVLVCLVVAKAAESWVLRRARTEGREGRDSMVWEIGHGGVRRLTFPLVALGLVLVARASLSSLMHVNLLSLAVPLLGSLAAIRMVFYVLRHSFSGAAWLASFERAFALVVWGLAALYITGILPEVIAVLESISFSVGKQKLSLLQMLHGVVIVLATVLGALWVGGLVEARLAKADGLDSNLRAVFSRLARALLIVVAVLISLPLVGIDLTTLSVFGGALGVGLGFGLQKIASNYVSGFIILLDRSIRIGNTISVGNDRGIVTQITTRYTVLRGLSGVEALVPNELLVGSVVLNESYSDKQVRVVLPIQVAYEANIDQAMQIMIDAARAQARVLTEPAPAALLTSFADSGINLELGFWINDPENGTGSLRSDINLRIWREFQSAGIGIPYPQRELRILNGSSNV